MTTTSSRHRALQYSVPKWRCRRRSTLVCVAFLVFLDIQMPGFDGFSVVQGLMEVEPPLFVFVTAYSDHALKAFEAQAVDYLMKPGGWSNDRAEPAVSVGTSALLFVADL